MVSLGWVSGILSGTPLFDADAAEDEEYEFDDPQLSITVIPVAGMGKRQRWSAGRGRDRTILCQAQGGKFSELIGEGQPGGPCKPCPYGQWKRDEEGLWVTGCDRIISLLVYVVEWDTFCGWDLARTAWGMGEFIHQVLTERGGGDILNGYTNVAFQIWATESVGGRTNEIYDTSGGDQCILKEAAKPQPVAAGRRNRRANDEGNMWYLPECVVLAGTLEDNNIIFPEGNSSVPTIDDDPPPSADDLPF